MFLSLTINGLAMGLSYSLLAVGILLIVRSVKIINLAQGDFFSLGAYITYILTATFGVSTLPMLAVTILLFGLLGVIFLFTCVWPLRNSKVLFAPMISTIGASLVVRETCKLIGGTEVKMADPLISGGIRIGSSILKYQYLVIMGAAIVLIALVFILFEKMYIGRIMEAAAQDRYAATLIGIPTLLTLSVVFMIVMIITGIDGWLVAPTFLVTTSLSVMQMRAFAGVIVGGFTSLKGAIVGSMIIGLLESYCTYFTTTYKDVVVFCILILVLLIRPQGIFGEEVAEKA